MHVRTIILCFIGFVMMSGCFDTSYEEIVDNYELVTIDDHHPFLAYSTKSGSDIVIEWNVVDVDYNTEFITVKQYRVDTNSVIDSSKPYYYIIPRKAPVHESPTQNKLGPFSLDDFFSKCHELGVPDSLCFVQF